MKVLSGKLAWQKGMASFSRINLGSPCSLWKCGVYFPFKKSYPRADEILLTTDPQPGRRIKVSHVLCVRFPILKSNLVGRIDSSCWLIFLSKSMIMFEFPEDLELWYFLMVCCKKTYIELHYSVKNKVHTALKDIPVSLVNPSCPPSSLNLWLRLVAVTQESMLMKHRHIYLSMIISCFLWKEAQFIEDSVHVRITGQDYILNICLLFTSFPPAS